MRLYRDRGMTKDGKWVYGYYVFCRHYNYILPIDTPDCGFDERWPQAGSHTDDGWFEVIPETVGQNTGLKDKNGKEDYDGNIWEVEYRGKIHRFLHQKVLGCDGYEFEFKCLTGEVSSVHANVSEDGIIIGSIHENPELLKD